MSGPAGAGRASRRSTIISSIADRAADGVAKPFIAKPASQAHHARMMRHLPAALLGIAALAQIGRASCRERVCQYVSISGVDVSLKNKKQKSRNSNHNRKI